MARFSLERPRGVTKVSWVTLLGIVLVPLVIGGLLVWALWNPTERLNRITAAVVNEDTPVEINGQTVPLGRQLASGLVTGGTNSATDSSAATPTPGTTPAPNVSGSDSSSNFTWVLTDKDDAAKGLAEGSYATVVTIPSSFSAAATSYSGDAAKATKATIDIATSEKAKLVDDAISATVTSTATSLLNTQLTTAYLENVYVGFTTLHDQIGQAAEGAGTLADGADQLSTGASSLADGTGSLATGVGELATGALSLSNGVAQLGTGASSLADGVGKLGTGASDLSGAVAQLATGARSSATGAATLQGGASSLADGLDRLRGGVEKTGEGTQQVAALSAGAATATAQTLAGLSTVLESCTTEQCVAAKAVLASASGPTGAVTLTQQTAGAVAGIDVGIRTGGGGQPSLIDAVGQSAAGARSLADGIGQLSGGLTQLAGGADAAAGGAAQLATGATSAAQGARDLATGATTAAGGAAQLATGASSAADGATQLADGATGVSDGAVQLTDGTRSLATGLDAAVAQLPTYTDSESTNLADVVADPVENASSTNDLFGAASVPFFATIALWLGALATFLVLAAFSHRALSSTRSSAALALSSSVPALVIGVVQGLAVAIVMSNVAGLEPGRWVGFALLSMLAGASFAAVNQGLVALLGGVGRFLSMVAAVIALGAGIISTVPGLLTDVLGFLPLSAAQNALSGVVEGTEGTAGAVVGLVVWLLFGLLLTVVAIARRRVTSVRALRRTAEA